MLFFWKPISNLVLINLKSNECYCGNHPGKYGYANMCNITCNGNSSETCGGFFTNSIYYLPLCLSSNTTTTTTTKTTTTTTATTIEITTTQNTTATISLQGNSSI